MCEVKHGVVYWLDSSMLFDAHSAVWPLLRRLSLVVRESSPGLASSVQPVLLSLRQVRHSAFRVSDFHCERVSAHLLCLVVPSLQRLH